MLNIVSSTFTDKYRPTTDKWEMKMNLNYLAYECVFDTCSTLIVMLSISTCI